MITKEELKNIGWNDLLPINLGGTGRMFLIKTKGRDYIFKPAEKKYSHEKERFRGIVQEAASKIQRIVDEESYVPCIYFENKELAGSLQIKYKIDVNAPNYYYIQRYDDFELTENEINQFLREYITDYLLCNFDAHGSNFITDSNGIIRGVDKEQCFRYINTHHDFFDIYDNPNDVYGESETIYNYLFKRYINKTIDIDFSILDKYIQKIENINDEDYIKIFEEYIDARKHRIEPEYLKKLILERKQNIRKALNSFIVYLNEERNKVKGNRL